DLVLLDVMMPGMTGYDVCKKIKERSGQPFLPVLLVTALSEQEQKNLGLQAGADDFLTKPVDRRELLLRVRSFLRLRAQDALIRLSTAVEGDPVASVDGKLVRRAIENLLGNAMKYTPAGRDVSVALRHRDAAVEIEVADRGPGIPAELRSTMFQKYGSVEAKKGGSRKGFGLGLYMVKLVADGHGGAAEVVDREGGGAVFRVRLRTTA